MTVLLGIVVGVVAALALRALLVRGLLWKLRRDVAALAAGDHRPLLAGYSRDAVLEFHDGEHRFAGTWSGRDRIEEFLRLFVTVGLHGEIESIAITGPPWNLTVMARFDDTADLDGERLYANRTVLVCRTRWGKIVHQDDFYADTARIGAFDQALADRGI